MTNHPYFLLMLAPLIWGGNAIAGKIAVGEIAPMTLVLLRWIVALIVLLPFCLPKVKQEWIIIRAHWLKFFSLGVFGFAGFNMLNYAALHYTTALNTSLMQAAIPMMILLINSVLFRQRLARLQVLGILSALSGVVLIVSAGELSRLTQLSFNQGDLLMLLACLMYAGYSLGLKYKPEMSWASFIFVLAASALIAVLPFSIYEMVTTKGQVFNFSIKSVLLVIYISVLASIIGQLAYAKGVAMIGAGRAGFAINLVPVFGAFLAVIFLGESFQWFHFVGLILVLGGIALSERLAKR